VRVGVVGARGHVGGELLRLLSRHPRLELALVTSRELEGRAVRDKVPELATDLRFENLGPEACADRALDAYVLALPDGTSEAYVWGGTSAVLVDLSSDHRFDDAWVYGQPERNRSAIRGAKRIANPGCYATALQLALDPLLDELAGTPHAFGVSGYSGAGTTPSPRNDPEVLRDNLVPYTLVDHTHEREVTRQLGREVYFLPHVAPFFRGITITLSLTLAEERSREDIETLLKARYEGERLVRVVGPVPHVRDIVGRHEVVIGGVHVTKGGTHAAVVACIDNLLGGAATQAVRNLNLALGLPELEGIDAWLD
jgi:N-acetyl-gamma-glutamyl-phosphate reductase